MYCALTNACTYMSKPVKGLIFYPNFRTTGLADASKKHETRYLEKKELFITQSNTNIQSNIICTCSLNTNPKWKDIEG